MCPQQALEMRPGKSERENRGARDDGSGPLSARFSKERNLTDDVARSHSSHKSGSRGRTGENFCRAPDDQVHLVTGVALPHQSVTCGVRLLLKERNYCIQYRRG